WSIGIGLSGSAATASEPEKPAERPAASTAPKHKRDERDGFHMSQPSPCCFPSIIPAPAPSGTVAAARGARTSGGRARAAGLEENAARRGAEERQHAAEQHDAGHREQRDEGADSGFERGRVGRPERAQSAERPDVEIKEIDACDAEENDLEMRRRIVEVL